MLPEKSVHVELIAVRLQACKMMIGKIYSQMQRKARRGKTLVGVLVPDASDVNLCNCAVVMTQIAC